MSQIAPHFHLERLAKRALNRFAADERGAMAVMFVLLLTVTLGLIGGAIDFARVTTLKIQAQNAADAAILLGVKTAQNNYENNQIGWDASGQTAAAAAFAANMAGSSSPGTASASITRNGASISGAMKYSGALDTAFLQLFGLSQIDFAGTATAQIDLKNYVSVHFLIDATASMGIGAEPSDQQTMYDKIGCALACHYNEGGWVDNLAAARASGATLRIDVVRNAVRDFIAKAKTAQTMGAGTIQISIDLFSNDIVPLLAPTTDLTAADAAAAKIDLVNTPGTMGTNISYSLSRFAAKYPQGGDGSSQAAPKSFVVLLTDGIEDSRFGFQAGAPGTITSETVDPYFIWNAPTFYGGGTEYSQTFNPQYCQPLKQKNNTVVTGRIKYLIPSLSAGYNIAPTRFYDIDTTLTPLATQAMQQCATDATYAYAAASTAELQAMVSHIADAILLPKQLRLTN